MLHVGQGRRRQVAQHVIHLGQRVGDRRAGGKDHAFAVLLHDVLGLDVHVVGALTAFRRTHAAHVLHLGGVHQVLEQMRLVDHHHVDAKLLEVQQVIHGLIAQALDPFLEAVAHCRELLHGAPGRRIAGVFLVATALFGLSAHRLDLGNDVRNLPFREYFLELRRRLDESERRMRQDDRVPIAGGDLGQETPTVDLLEILLGRRQDFRARIQAVEVGRPLLDQVVRHRDKRLPRQPGAAQFHRRSDDRIGLAGADHMVQQHLAVLHDARDGVALMLAELDDLVWHLARETQQ